MTNNIKIGIEAVNRWVFYGWNYEMVEIARSPTNEPINVPKFIVEVQWTCNQEHMIEKWWSSCKGEESSAYLVNFYAKLDYENRIKLVEWVLENYVGEGKLF